METHNKIKKVIEKALKGEYKNNELILQAMMIRLDQLEQEQGNIIF